MAQVTVDLPETLQHQLEGLAQYEGIQLSQYILYVLTQRASEVYQIHRMPDETISQQEASYLTLRQRWGTATPVQVREFLDSREEAEPEPELKSELVARVRQRIEEKEQAGV